MSSGQVRSRGKAPVKVEIKGSRGGMLRSPDRLAERVKSQKPVRPLMPQRTRAAAEPPSARVEEDDKAEQEIRRQKALQARVELDKLKSQRTQDDTLARDLEHARHDREKREALQRDALLQEQQKQQQLEAEELARQEAEQRGRGGDDKAAATVLRGSPGHDPNRSDRESQERQIRERKLKPSRTEIGRRRQGKLTISQALRDDGEGRGRSVAALRRQRERERARNQDLSHRSEKVVREVTLPETISVGELANRMAVRGSELIRQLFKNDMVVKLNSIIDADTAELLIEEFGHKVRRVSDSDIEDDLLKDWDEGFEAIPRSPVVTVMGHVDHGKTTLLDTLRKSRIAAGEAGGITQHIAAYRVPVKDQQITFLDTPGHAAFSEMRSRGARVTDIVVLVVAANDGVLPQTIEAINHAKAAKVPLVVAINKCDLAEADPARARNDLLQHGVIGEENGGETLMIEISALKGDGLDKLLEAILLQAELLELKAVSEGRARGVVIEASQEKGRGVVATVLVQSGKLQRGDIFVAGHEWGRVKIQHDDQGKVVNQATPSTPVEIQGLQGVVNAGDELIVVNEEIVARNVADYRQRKINEARLSALSRNSVDQMFQNIAGRKVSELNVILRADVLGSQEAIVQALQKLSNDEVEVKVVHSGIGAITESDVTLANSSNALLIGFNIRANAQARELARREGIAVRYFSIIYELIDDVRGLAEGLLAPAEREEFLGYAEVKEVFQISKLGNVAGCLVTEGVVQRGAEVRLLRDDVVIYRGKLAQLRRHKDDVKEVRSGTECGMALENHNDIVAGDRVECFTVLQERRTLE